MESIAASSRCAMCGAKSWHASSREPQDTSRPGVPWRPWRPLLLMLARTRADANTARVSRAAQRLEHEPHAYGARKQQERAEPHQPPAHIREKAQHVNPAGAEILAEPRPDTPDQPERQAPFQKQRCADLPK